MGLWILIIFIVGYTAIALESVIRINKAASALLTGVLCWIFIAISGETTVESFVTGSLGDIASILFFLLGAMTIVELIDLHEGFDIIRNSIRTESYNKLLLITGILTFFLSAVLDNLTTAIIMTSLVSKIIQNPYDRRWFAAVVILISNAGGAWSPIGDVTTTMLWVGGQISPEVVIKGVFIPALMVSAVPLIYILYKFRNRPLQWNVHVSEGKYSKKEEMAVLFTGIILLVLIPVFKTLTGLPPFMGMLLALGMIWLLVSIMHRQKTAEDQTRYSVSKALQQIDAPGILFFLGILLAVEALTHAGLLRGASQWMQDSFSGIYIPNLILGFLSAIVDNVPLVAAAQDMFAESYPANHVFWQLLALTSGTGGSMVIIGSAAGVAVMGMEDIPFGWYLRKIGWLAMIGFLSGVVVFALLH